MFHVVLSGRRGIYLAQTVHGGLGRLAHEREHGIDGRCGEGLVDAAAHRAPLVFGVDVKQVLLFV